MQKVLVIEDEEVMRQGLVDLLRGSNYEAVSLDLLDNYANLSTLIEQILAIQPNLILLDINLPGINGGLLLKSLRAKSDIPIIMVTSSSMEMDEVLSMSYGADDYVTKPYNPQILLLRIAAVLKRMDSQSGPIIFHGLQIDLNRGAMERSSAMQDLQKVPKRVLLTKNEMIILGHLLKHQGEIVTLDALMTDLWNNHEYINDNALTVNISRLRAKFKSFGLEDYIETRKGLGYILS